MRSLEKGLLYLVGATLLMASATVSSIFIYLAVAILILLSTVLVTIGVYSE